MPQRNLMLIAVTAVISLICYGQAARNRYTSTLTMVMSEVEDKYLKPVERRELLDHALKGMVTGLDPYSGYMTEEEFRPFIEGIEQKFGGVGILVEVNPETKRLTVMSPLFDTPAYRAGLKSGDTIMSIDGKDTEGLELRDSVKLMKGDPNTQVTLGILHRGEKEVVEYKLTRAIIRTESVLGDKRIEGAQWDFHLQEDERIAYLRVSTFGDKTADEIEAALTKDGRFADYQAIVLDLRGNPGGTLDGAVKICDMFLDRGTIVSTRGRGDVVEREYSAERGVLVPDDVPVVVLVNHYSASASEIVAACLQDHGRAKVVGERTWGKGTVQNVFELDNGGALRLTTSSYWRPSNVNIHRDPDAKDEDTWGVSPDPGMEVKLTDEELIKVLEARAAKDMFRPYAEQQKPMDPPMEPKEGDPPAEDAAKFDDPQLRKAIDHLQKLLDMPAKA